MSYRSIVTAGSLVLGVCLTVAGCGQAPLEAPAAAPIPVAVSSPVERYVTDYADFTARTAAVDSVAVRAHVWGYLNKVNFTEGALVKKGDVLCELDPRPYENQLRLDEAQLANAEAANRLADLNFRRAAKLLKQDGVAQQEYDQNKATKEQTEAEVQRAKANIAISKLNLEYSKVIAPVSGRVSRYVVTVGNLIQSGDQNGGTLLTTIVSVDPMYAYFDVDEYTVLRVRQLVREGKSDSPRDGGYPVSLGLANEAGHPHRGTINFVDNQVNPKTGTIRARGVFPNKQEHLLPGFFARIRVPIGRPHQALLVSDRALDTDQGQKILYLVNEKNEVVSRPVRLGALHDGLREITDGVRPGDRVIVNGLQQVRPGVTVQPKLVDMPASQTRRQGDRETRRQAHQAGPAERLAARPAG